MLTYYFFSLFQIFEFFFVKIYVLPLVNSVPFRFNFTPQNSVKLTVRAREVENLMSTYQIYGKKASTLIYSMQEKMLINSFLMYVYLPRETMYVDVHTCTYVHMCVYMIYGNI